MALQRLDVLNIWLESEDLCTLARCQKAVKTDIGAHIVEDTAGFQSFLKNPLDF